MSDRKMIIHILVNCFWKSGMSGGDRRVIEVVKRWAQSDACKLIVYGPQSFINILMSETDGIETCVTDVGVPESAGIISAYFRRTKNLVKILDGRVNDGDIVYSSSDIMPDVIPALHSKKRSQVKWVLLTHHINEAFYKRPGSIITNFISCTQQVWGVKKGIRYSDIYFVISPQVMKQFAEKGYSQDKIKRIDNAVDMDLIERSDKEVDSYDAVFMARLSPSKGVLELPEIWSKVVSSNSEARLGIIGKGSDDMVDALKQRINDLGLQRNIDVLGFVDSERGYSLIKKAKCFLFTSHEEGWGIAVAEALACNTPVVAYDLPVFPVLFEYGTVLCPLGDTDAMAGGVIRLLEDDNYRESLGAQGAKYVKEHYAWDTVAKEELEFICGLSAENKRI